MSLDYNTYLKLDSLLALQQPKSREPAHDELLFIVIHQVYELWFKVVLHEADSLIEQLQAGDRGSSLGVLKRLVAIHRVLANQLEVLETMTPRSFARFRSFLDSASGFQSVQFRELEVLLGRRDAGVLEHHEPGSGAYARLQQRLAGPSVFSALLRLLQRKGYELSEQTIAASLDPRGGDLPEARAALDRIYREDPGTTALCEALVDLDQWLQQWRYRHVKVVERIIGTAQGTGGSRGAEYLRSTLFRPVFPLLWDFRASAE